MKNEKTLYLVIEWGKEPIPIVTKKDLSELVNIPVSNIEKMFFQNWFAVKEKYIIVKTHIPKVKSKIRR